MITVNSPLQKVDLLLKLQNIYSEATNLSAFEYRLLENKITYLLDSLTKEDKDYFDLLISSKNPQLDMDYA